MRCILKKKVECQGMTFFIEIQDIKVPKYKGEATFLLRFDTDLLKIHKMN